MSLSLKVMVNLPFHPSESVPPLVFTAQFEWDVMSPVRIFVASIVFDVID